MGILTKLGQTLRDTFLKKKTIDKRQMPLFKELPVEIEKPLKPTLVIPHVATYRFTEDPYGFRLTLNRTKTKLNIVKVLFNQEDIVEDRVVATIEDQEKSLEFFSFMEKVADKLELLSSESE